MGRPRKVREMDGEPLQSPDVIVECPIQENVDDNLTAADMSIKVPVTVKAIATPPCFCSECGAMLAGCSPTGPMTRRFYMHPYTNNSQTGQPCSFKGKKLRPVTVFLEVMED